MDGELGLGCFSARLFLPIVSLVLPSIRFLMEPNDFKDTFR
jgi:hypothetical protein